MAAGNLRPSPPYPFRGGNIVHKSRIVARQHKTNSAGAGNVDKIRDILFGNQMRDYEKKFARVEEKLQKESGDLRDDTRKRIANLEAYIRKEIEETDGRIKTEHDERVESSRSLSIELRETAKNLEKMISQLEEQMTKNHRDLRQQLLEQSKNLSEEVRTASEQLRAALDRAVMELGSEKVARSSLGALFSEMALRLNDEFQIEGLKDDNNE
jgi:hypothetical protein